MSPCTHWNDDFWIFPLGRATTYNRGSEAIERKELPVHFGSSAGSLAE